MSDTDAEQHESGRTLNPEGAAFDSLADHYDQDYTRTFVGEWLRERVHARLNAHFKTDEHVLELGCGTGEDTRRLVERGVRVTGTDLSAGMLDAARTKLVDNPLATFVQLDLGSLSPDVLPGPFDGAFSNFGPLNCLDGWGPLAAWLAARIRPGGMVGLCVMGPLCLWEIGWHVLHGELRTAFRRFRKSSMFQTENGQPIMVRYPSPQRLQRDFAPWFRQIDLRGIGVFLPPTEVYGVLDKRPKLLKNLIHLEERLAHRRPFVFLGDHYWIELKRLP